MQPRLLLAMSRFGNCSAIALNFLHDPEQTFGTKGLRENKKTQDGLMEYTEEMKHNSSVKQEVVLMFFQYDTDSNEKQTAEEESQFWVEQLETYLTPYSERLDAYLDRRVVGNLTATVAGIVQTRSALTTSEVGSALCGPEHAEAGTQRLQRAVHHRGWASEVIEEVLWDQAETRRKEMEERGETPLCIWDSSVLEKPESAKLEGLGAVRSSRVRRLARSRKGGLQSPQWHAGECARL
jgi:hypothetical protein